MRNILFVVLLLALSFRTSAQQKPIPPLDVPQSFSGTYGELRHNHFHGGIDWRTGGVTGVPLHAIMDGYVCRLSVSNYGYGNAVYIRHPNGTISLYGHMQCFSPQLTAIMRFAQYDDEEYCMDVYLDKDDFPVKQGDYIGKSGNSGSSGGPHLHLELRDTLGNSFNYLQKGWYSVEDNIAPNIRKVNFYAYNDTLPTPASERIFSLVPGKTVAKVTLPRKSYLAIDAIDRQNGTTGKLAVTIYSVLLDKDTIFTLKIGDIPKKSDRYIQSLIEYPETVSGHPDMIRTLQNPVNLLDGWVSAKEGGVIVLNDFLPHTIKVEVSDEHGNKTNCMIPVQRDDKSVPASVFAKDTTFSYSTMFWFTPNLVAEGGVTFSIPYSALYRTIELPYKRISAEDHSKNRWSDLWTFGDASVPLHKQASLSIRCNLPDTLRSKAFIASCRGGKMYYAGGHYEDGTVRSEVGFGTYCVAIDTVAPVAVFKKYKNGSIVSGNIITVNLSDDLSGIFGTSVDVDGEWVLNNRRGGKLTVWLDDVKKGKHELRIKVWDNSGNETVVRHAFAK